MHLTLEYKSETSIPATCIHVGLLYKNFFVFTLQLTFVLEKNVKMVLLFPVKRHHFYGGSPYLSHHSGSYCIFISLTCSFDSSVLIYVPFLLHIFAELVSEKKKKNITGGLFTKKAK